MQRIAITGAGGFVGSRVPAKLRAAGYAGEIRLFDRAFLHDADHETVVMDLASSGAAREVAAGADCVIHLAAMPGAAAEQDPAGSQKVNLDLPLALMNATQGRLILASSIAVFGGTLPAVVDDVTEAVPNSVYGTHKRMTELAFADAVRRSAIGGVCLRLPGIVARPSGAQGFGSAFLSEIFHAAKGGRKYTIPVAPDATSWLMSVDMCARNLAHAALASFDVAVPLNLPSVTVSIGDLAGALAKAGFAGDFDFHEDETLRRTFGSYPPLRTARSDRLGFVSDIDAGRLVENVMADV